MIKRTTDDYECLGCIVVGIIVIVIIALAVTLSLGIAYGLSLLIRWFGMQVGLDQHTSTILGIVAAILCLLGGASRTASSKS